MRPSLFYWPQAHIASSIWRVLSEMAARISTIFTGTPRGCVYTALELVPVPMEQKYSRSPKMLKLYEDM